MYILTIDGYIYGSGNTMLEVQREERKRRNRPFVINVTPVFTEIPVKERMLFSVRNIGFLEPSIAIPSIKTGDIVMVSKVSELISYVVLNGVHVGHLPESVFLKCFEYLGGSFVKDEF